MFGYVRRKTHRQLAKAELNQSLGHLRQAANHTAGGIGATVGPRMEAARDRMAPATDRVRKSAATGLLAASSALTPLVVAARSGAQQSGSMTRDAKRKTRKAAAKKAKADRSRRRWPLMLAAGLAVGAVTAKAVRRRREQEQWESYDPQAALETARSGELSAADTLPLDQPEHGAVGTAKSTTAGATAPGSLSEQARKANESAGEKFSSTTGTMTEGSRQTGSRIAGRTENALGNTNPPGSNNRR